MVQNQRYIAFGYAKNISKVVSSLPIITEGMRITVALAEVGPAVDVRQICGAVGCDRVHILPYLQFNGDM